MLTFHLNRRHEGVQVVRGRHDEASPVMLLDDVRWRHRLRLGDG